MDHRKAKIKMGLTGWESHLTKRRKNMKKNCGEEGAL
jgi:hypothetical protein